MADDHENFAYSTVATAPSPPSSGTSLIVQAGEGALFPTPPFNATIWPSGSQPLASNAEIVRVTNIATDTLTIVRQQEGTSARTVLVGDQIAATITDKTLADAEAGGSNTHVQYNASGVFAGEADFSYDAATNVLTVAGAVKTPALKDTGGTTRITLASSSPHVTVAATMKVNEALGIRGNPSATGSEWLSLTAAVGGVGAFVSVLKLQPTLYSSQASTLYFALEGIFTVRSDGSGQSIAHRGLSYVVSAVNLGANTNTWSELYSVAGQCYVQAGSSATLNVTALAGLFIDSPSLSGTVANINITAAYGILVKQQGHARMSMVCGIAVEDVTAGTNKYVAELGGTLGSLPYLRVIGGWTPAVNATPIYISEGVTPNLRQILSINSGTNGANLDDIDVLYLAPVV